MKQLSTADIGIDEVAIFRDIGIDELSTADIGVDELAFYF